jgi:acid phosphatase (class A)
MNHPVALCLLALSLADPPKTACPPQACAPGDAPLGARLAVSTDHYVRLAQIDASPRDGFGALDRRLFDLAAMSPGYFKILSRPPAYLDVPATVFSLPEFPANSSAQTRAELDYLLELQARSRTPEAVARSRALAGVFYKVGTQPGDEDYERMRRNLFFVGSALGGWFAPETLPKTADLMARVQSDATYYIWAQKYRFDRARPYELEPRIERLETPNFPAYPSAHSANSWVAAFVFAELLPEERETFTRGAAEMAFSREILGVHFPSDSESGRLLARQIVDRMREVPQFRRDLAAAREEILGADRASKRASGAAAGAKNTTSDCF